MKARLMQKIFGYRNPSKHPLKKIGSDWVVHETGLLAEPVTWEELMKEKHEKTNEQTDQAIAEADKKYYEAKNAGVHGPGTSFHHGACMGFDLGRAQGIREALNFMRSERMSLSQVFVDTIEKHLTSKPRT